MHLDIARGGVTTSLLAEECFVAGFRGRAGERPAWLPAAEAEALLRTEPAVNVHPGQREAWLREAIGGLSALRPAITALVEERAAAVLAAHERVRAAARLRGVRYAVRPTLPADVLGVYVLMPVGATVMAGD